MDKATLHEQFDTYLAGRGLRSTPQRRRIAEFFFSTPGHVALDEIHGRVRRREPRIGFATVYRTMKLLHEGGLANERRFGDGVTRYEVAAGVAHHEHLVCLACGRIVEFEEPRVERIQDEVAARHGFELLWHKHDLYGRCARCRREGRHVPARATRERAR